MSGSISISVPDQAWLALTQTTPVVPVIPPTLMIFQEPPRHTPINPLPPLMPSSGVKQGEGEIREPDISGEQPP